MMSHFFNQFIMMLCGRIGILNIYIQIGFYMQNLNWMLNHSNVELPGTLFACLCYFSIFLKAGKINMADSQWTHFIKKMFT